jgi:hypothetical protein
MDKRGGKLNRLCPHGGRQPSVNPQFDVNGREEVGKNADSLRISVEKNTAGIQAVVFGRKLLFFRDLDRFLVVFLAPILPCSAMALPPGFTVRDFPVCAV